MGQLFQVLSLRNLPEEGGKCIFYYNEWLDHPDYDDYWKALANEECYSDIQVLVLQIGGWYDFFTADTSQNFIGMRHGGGSILSRKNQRAIVGPWIYRASTTTYAGEVDFGSASLLDLQEIELRWFNRRLKGLSNFVLMY